MKVLQFETNFGDSSKDFAMTAARDEREPSMQRISGNLNASSPKRTSGQDGERDGEDVELGCRVEIEMFLLKCKA